MFAIPLVGLKGTAESAPLWLKLASASGLLMTLLYAGLSILPVIRVESHFAFAARITSVVVAANLIGLAVFLIAERRRKRVTLSSAAD